MMRCRNLLSEVIIVPSEPFQYQLRGYDSDGNSFVKTKEFRLKPVVKVCTLPTPTPSTTFITTTITTTTTAANVKLVFTAAGCLLTKIY